MFMVGDIENKRERWRIFR